MTITPTRLFLATLSLALCVSAQAADPAAGAAKAKEVCMACHGMDGNSPSPDFPKIGGQYVDYLKKALRDYKGGARKNAIMAGFAGALSDKDIDNLAEHYAKQPPHLRTFY